MLEFMRTEDENKELNEILAAVESFNAKRNGTDRLLRLTLLLAFEDEPIALLAGPPIRNQSSAQVKLS